MDDESFIEIVKSSFSIAECIKKQGLICAGSNYKRFHDRVKRLNLDTSHFLGQGYLKGKTHTWAPEISIEKAFVEKSLMQTCNIRRKILKYNLLPYKCSICGISDWLCQELSFHLDHINGINNDHRLENLRFLCPNCHSQTETYCGKNKGKNN